MKSKFQLTAAGAFLVCVGAFVLYLSMAPDVPVSLVPLPAQPPQDKAPLSPAPEPVIEQSPPDPAPQPEPEPAPLPDPEPLPELAPPPPEENKSIGDYGGIQGVVTRSTVPVPRVKVTAIPDAASGDVTGLTTDTDNRGNFKLPRVPTGRVVLHFTNLGASGELTQEAMVFKDQTSSIDVRLPGQTATLEGFIHAGGRGLPATISITMRGDGMEQSRIVNTSDGHYVADDLLPGVIELVAEAEHPPGERKVRTDSFGLQPGEFLQKDYSFSLPPVVRGQIAGVEQDERTYVLALYGAIEAGETFATPQGVSERLAKMTGPDKEGNYQLDGLEPGTYTILVFSMRMGEEGAEPVYQSAYQVIELADEAEVAVDLAIKW